VKTYEDQAANIETTMVACEEACMSTQAVPHLHENLFSACSEELARLVKPPVPNLLLQDPGILFRLMGMQADWWQVQLLTTKAPRLLCLQARQSGKSTGVAALALKQALLEPESEILILSPSLRQSVEDLRKAKQFQRVLIMGERSRRRRKGMLPSGVVPEDGSLPSPLTSFKEAEQQSEKDAEETARFLERYANDPDFKLARNAEMTVEFGNGSRIRSLPCSSDTIVGPSPDLLIIDEAARVPDNVYAAMRPTLSRSRGQLVACSTPFGKQGWFWEAWDRTSKQKELVARYNGGESQESLARSCSYPLEVVVEILKAGGKPLWETIRVSCEDCPWLTPTFLAEERLEIGERWYRQEYECNPYEAPIWMGDFSFCPIGQVKVGDEVIGWRRDLPDPTFLFSTYSKRYLVKGQVLHVGSREAEVVKVVLESGRSLICTRNHLWLRMGSGNRASRKGRLLSGEWFGPPYVGSSLAHVIDPTKPLPEHLYWDAAWLGGIYDGEGCGDSIAQSRTHNPEIRERIEKVLRSLGFSVRETNEFAVYFKSSGGREGRRQSLVDFINWTRPTHCRPFMTELSLRAHFRHRDKVAKVSPAGTAKVYALQTTTGNYVAWGYASKNCEFCNTVDAVFAQEDICRALTEEVQPLFEV
jgi:hypothetical protein